MTVPKKMTFSHKKWLPDRLFLGGVLLGAMACQAHADGDFDAYHTDGSPVAVRIPAGSFSMGLVVNKENPVPIDDTQVVTLNRSFYIMKTEVLQGVYERVMGNNPSVLSECGPGCPVENISWRDATLFANALSLQDGLKPCYEINEQSVLWPMGLDCEGWRLPTEAEWEYAARGGERFRFAGSKNVEEVAWVRTESSLGKTHPACQKVENGYGLCDMSGNVSEWTWDWHKPTFKDKKKSRQPYYVHKVCRGGAYDQSAKYAKVTQSYRCHPTVKRPYIGFRLVRTEAVRSQ